jgi:hypothetical protein
MAKPLTLCGLLCLLLAGTASGRTWNVFHDGTGDAPTIQAGMDSASAGDTVLVHPGEYYLNLGMKSTVSLVSSDGPDVTVLKNELGGDYPIINACCRAALIEGFTFRGEPGRTGAGIMISCHAGELAAEIIGNVFDRLTWYEGAGVCCYSGSQAYVSQNVFQDCTGWNAGGGALVFSGSFARIVNNTFIRCYSKAGGAICCSYDGTCVISGNLIESNEALERGGGVFLHECPSGSVTYNTFKSNHADISGGGIYLYDGDYEFSYNVLWSNDARYGGGIAQAPGAALVSENNTFYRNEATDRGSAADLRGNVTSRFTNCIISNSAGAGAVDCYGTILPAVDCNVFWMNPSDYTGCPPGPHDINACPSFCFADHGNFTLCDGSPCLPDNHPMGGYCGLIGAKWDGCSCGPTADVPTTWGEIKSMFR